MTREEEIKHAEGCKFCKQEEVITHRLDECELSYDGEGLCVDVNIPVNHVSVGGYYGFSINYCPMCGMDLRKIKHQGA